MNVHFVLYLINDEEEEAHRRRASDDFGGLLQFRKRHNSFIIDRRKMFI